MYVLPIHQEDEHLEVGVADEVDGTHLEVGVAEDQQAMQRWEVAGWRPPRTAAEVEGTHLRPPLTRLMPLRF